MSEVDCYHQRTQAKSPRRTTRPGRTLYMVYWRDANTPYIGCQNLELSRFSRKYRAGKQCGYAQRLDRRNRSSFSASSSGCDSSGPFEDNPRVDQLLLIVEDDPSLREVIRLGLEGEGFRVAAAEDGPSALIAFASHHAGPGPLDVMLPGLDGFAVCRELRKVSLAAYRHADRPLVHLGCGGGSRSRRRRLRDQAFRVPRVDRPRPLGPAPSFGEGFDGSAACERGSSPAAIR